MDISLKVTICLYGAGGL